MSRLHAAWLIFLVVMLLKAMPPKDAASQDLALALCDYLAVALLKSKSPRVQKTAGDFAALAIKIRNKRHGSVA